MSVSHEARRAGRRSLLGLPVFGLLALAWAATAQAQTVGQRLFIQVWWDSPPIEMDPSDDPGRVEVYVGETFVGCAQAPSHVNYRKQLMLVPPALGFTGTGAPSAVRVTVTGHLSTLPARHIKITQI